MVEETKIVNKTKGRRQPKRFKKAITKKGQEFPNVKLFNKWDLNIEVFDPGLKPYINLRPCIIPRTAGINQKRRFHKSRMNVVERLILHLLCPGHTGKKHKITSGHLGGSYYKATKIMENALDIIAKEMEKETKQPVNSLEIFVRAIENASVREEITSFRVGSIISRSAVVTAPQRRIDKTLRYFAQGAYRNSFNKKKSIERAVAEEIIAAYKNMPECIAIKEKERLEREAAGAR